MAEHRGSEIIAGGGITVIRSVSKTRPADTTAYAAGDVINESTSAGTVWTFADAARMLGGSGIINKVEIVDYAYVATTLQCELWLFNTTVGADFDNAVFTPTDAELLTRVAVIPISTAYVGDATAGTGGNVSLTSGVVNQSFKCAIADDSLYGVLVARNAYVPISGEIFNIQLFIYQD